ncbi:hypothetical protein GCM10023189_57780 [Nibrella saemangeumensis]|uniref:Inner membrane protein YgaP-like transmembrane domain-containing protein n=1 Tax=Nibrella saemangeumensis TaxID=1084526 RepID=A0ABP8NN54_9BACT
MKRNLSNADIAARLITAVVIATLYYTNTFPQPIGIVLMVVAGALALTAYLTWCPIYQFIGFRTYSPKRKKVEPEPQPSV